jgi:cytochrome c553
VDRIDPVIHTNLDIARDARAVVDHLNYRSNRSYQAPFSEVIAGLPYGMPVSMNREEARRLTHAEAGTGHRAQIVAVLAAPVLGIGLASAARAAGEIPAAEVAAHGVSPGRPGCSSCHLGNGAGQPEVGIPRIAGLPETYIHSQLDYFAAGSRRNTAMAPYARMLSQQQREQLAAYYAAMQVPVADPAPSAAAAIEHGEVIAQHGIPETGTPSCSQCHGVSGLGVGHFSPSLAGQSASYIEEQLMRWHTGILRDPKGKFMRAEAAHLTEDDMRAVATYYASLPGGNGASR